MKFLLKSRTKGAKDKRKRKRKVFVNFNRGRKTFSGSDFHTGEVLFRNMKHIPHNKEDVIIHSGGNNIHPSLWSDDWFKEKKQKPKARLIYDPKDYSAKVDHQSNLHSLIGHSDHEKALYDLRNGKHKDLSKRLFDAATHSAQWLQDWHAKHGKEQ